MMQVSIVIDLVVQDGFPSGTVFGGLSVSILKRTGESFLGGIVARPTAHEVMNFAEVVPGLYTAVAQRLDGSDVPLGAPIKKDFEVPQTPTVSGLVPYVITVKLS